MVKIIQFLLFMFIFSCIYISINYYVFFRVLSFFEVKKNLIVWGAFFLLTFSFIIASLISKLFHNNLVRVIYVVANTYLGIFFFTLCVLLLYEIVNLIHKFDSRISGIVVLTIVGLLTLFSLINGYPTKTKTVEINDFGKEMTIVHLTDIHVGTYKNSHYLKDLVKRVNKINPDVVLITGDMVDGSGPLHYDSYAPLKGLNAKTYFTNGNHEQYEGLPEVEKIVEQLDMELLKNRMVEFNGVQIAGIDFSQSDKEAASRIERFTIDPEKPAILMNHGPNGAETAAKQGFDLQLSGHTHNGQIVPFNFLVRLQFKYVKGLFDVDGMKLYVSPGTSTWGPPMRLGSQNEIAIIKTK